MTILLFGGNGQLGWELRRSLSTLAPLLVATRMGDGGADLAVDFGRPDTVSTALRDARPDIIVNAAGYNDVDQAEREPELARIVNAEAPAVLARAAQAAGAWLVHFSSDYVFDGSGDAARDEDAPPGPLNAYGRSKLAGEQAIRASGCRHLILRTSWLHAPRGRNFVRAVLQRAAQQEAFDVVDDQIGAPTGADLVADIAAQALRGVLARPELGGTYNAAASGQTSRHGCAGHIVALARQQGWPLRATAASVRAVTTAAYGSGARRPLNSRLDTGRLRAAFHLHLPGWQTGIERTVSELTR